VRGYIEERVLEEAKFIQTKDVSLEKTAKLFGVSKSTVQKDMRINLPRINADMALEIDSILCGRRR
jgi:putative DeoR family transcriptional regulator (stage III sporulation protein D)